MITNRIIIIVLSLIVFTYCNNLTSQDKYVGIAIKIRQTYVKNMDKLTPYKRSHFAIRYYRMTGKSNLNSYISDYFDLINKGLYKSLRNFDKKEYALKRGEYYFDKLLIDYGKKRKGIERQKYFKDKKDLLFYIDLIEIGHIWNDMGFLKGEYKERYKKYLSYLKGMDLRSIFLDKELMKIYSTQLVTRVYQLKHHGVIDMEDDFTKRFQEIFKEPVEDDFAFKNKIYSLTHFIIAASNYYQKKVSKREFAWIFKYFNENIHKIIKKTNADIISEVGLCYLLAGIETSSTLDLVTDYVTKSFDPKRGYIPRKKGSLNESEHTNAVAFVLLRGMDKFHPGPRF